MKLINSIDINTAFLGQRISECNPVLISNLYSTVHFIDTIKTK